LEYAQVTSVSKRLKQLQKRLKIPIIELSQLSRECEKRKGDERCPQLSDFRSSGQLEQDASVVIGLYRPDYYGQKEQDSGEFYQDTNELWLDVLKARDGRTVTIKTACDIKTCRIFYN